MNRNKYEIEKLVALGLMPVFEQQCNTHVKFIPTYRKDRYMRMFLMDKPVAE